MANRLRGEAEFTHEGETYTMVLDAEALLQVEDMTGIGVLEMTLGKLGVLSALLMAGVQRGSGQELSRADAANILLVNGSASDAVIEAMKNAMPPKAGEGDGSPGPRKAAKKAGTGTKS